MFGTALREDCSVPFAGSAQLTTAVRFIRAVNEDCDGTCDRHSPPPQDQILKRLNSPQQYAACPCRGQSSSGRPVRRNGAVLAISSSKQASPNINTGRKLTTIFAALALSACHAQSGRAPIITSVTPATANITNGIPVEITVHGAGFDSLNTVHFGRLVIPSVPRLNDSTMRFGVPVDDTFLTDRGPAPVQPLASGAYDIRVESRRGRSNALRIMLVNDKGAR